jgi:foldase protein PrsA
LVLTYGIKCLKLISREYREEAKTLNNSKKVIKKPTQHKKKSAKAAKTSKLWIILSMILVVALVGGVLFDRLYQPVLLTLNGDKYHMNDLAYYFFNTEAQFTSYGSMFGDNFWDMAGSSSSGGTMRDTAIANAKDTALRTEILNREALADKYSLTAKEKKTIKTTVSSLLKSESTKNLVQKYDLTNSALMKAYSKATLSNRYRQDKIKAFHLDHNAIKATVNYDDFRQYDIEYLTIPTQKDDSKGKKIPLNSEEKSAAFDKINALYEKALKTKDWSTLIPKDEKELKYAKISFKRTDTTFDKAFEKMMMAMDNNAVSRVYEAQSGYYIVRMLNNNSPQSYNTAVKDAITKEENTRFDKLYTKDILPKYKYKWNEKEVSKIPMGKSKSPSIPAASTTN